MNLARAQNEDFQLVLTRYALERLAFSSEFTKDRGKQAQWRAFVGKGKLDTGGAGLEDVVDGLRRFLMPAAQSVAAGGLLEMGWSAAGPWRPW